MFLDNIRIYVRKLMEKKKGKFIEIEIIHNSNSNSIQCIVVDMYITFDHC